jgi:hypothetical protein
LLASHLNALLVVTIAGLASVHYRQKRLAYWRFIFLKCNYLTFIFKSKILAAGEEIDISSPAASAVDFASK